MEWFTGWYIAGDKVKCYYKCFEKSFNNVYQEVKKKT